VIVNESSETNTFMNGTELHDLELHEVAHLIQTRKVSPVELTETMLRRIESLDSRLHAYALVTPEHALEQARKAEDELVKRRYRGALHGVPIGLKDLCYTKGIPTAAGMPIYRDFKPAFDGTVVKRLYDAGAISLGKLQLTVQNDAVVSHQGELIPLWVDGIKPHPELSRRHAVRIKSSQCVSPRYIPNRLRQRQDQEISSPTIDSEFHDE